MKYNNIKSVPYPSLLIGTVIRVGFELVFLPQASSFALAFGFRTVLLILYTGIGRDDLAATFASDVSMVSPPFEGKTISKQELD